MINRNSKLSPTVNKGRTTSQKIFHLMVFLLIEVGFSSLIYLNFDELLLTLFLQSVDFPFRLMVSFASGITSVVELSCSAGRSLK